MGQNRSVCQLGAKNNGFQIISLTWGRKLMKPWAWYRQALTKTELQYSHWSWFTRRWVLHGVTSFLLKMQMNPLLSVYYRVLSDLCVGVCCGALKRSPVRSWGGKGRGCSWRHSRDLQVQNTTAEREIKKLFRKKSVWLNPESSLASTVNYWWYRSSKYKAGRELSYQIVHVIRGWWLRPATSKSLRKLTGQYSGYSGNMVIEETFSASETDGNKEVILIRETLCSYPRYL